MIFKKKTIFSGKMNMPENIVEQIGFIT